MMLYFEMTTRSKLKKWVTAKTKAITDQCDHFALHRMCHQTLPPDVDANSFVNGAFTSRSRREAYEATLKEDIQVLVDSGHASEQSVRFFSEMDQQ